MYHLTTDAKAVTQASSASIPAREADDEPSAHPPCHRPSCVHACHSTQSRQSRCMPTMSSIFLGLAPSFSSTTLTMPLQHSAVRCRLVVATVRVRVSFRSGFGSKAGASWQAQSDRPCSKPLQVTDGAARHVGATQVIGSAAALAFAIVSAMRPPSACSRRPSSSSAHGSASSSSRGVGARACRRDSLPGHPSPLPIARTSFCARTQSVEKPTE